MSVRERRGLIGKSETRRSAPKSEKLRLEMHKGREKKGGKVVGGSGTKSDGLRGSVNGLWIYEWPTPLGDTKANATNEHLRINSIWKSAYCNINYSFELTRDVEPPIGRGFRFLLISRYLRLFLNSSSRPSWLLPLEMRR